MMGVVNRYMGYASRKIPELTICCEKDTLLKKVDKIVDKYR